MIREKIMASDTFDDKKIFEELSEMHKLLEQLIAIQLYANGASQKSIASNMSISLTRVNAFVKGMKVKKGLE